MPKKILPKTQKIIVPKGTIDPTDDTIIEIPAGLYTQPVVIAKKKFSNRSLPILDDESCKSACGSANKTVAEINLSHVNRSGIADVSHSSRASQDLDETEYTEKEKVLKQLDEFQKARRKFLADTSAVANASAGNLGSADQSRTSFKETSVRWGNTSTQTSPMLPPIHAPLTRETYIVPPPPPFPPYPKIKDSLELPHTSMKQLKPLREERKIKKSTDVVESCSSNCKNLESKESSLVNLKDVDSELSDLDSDEDILFDPPMNSTFTVKKKKESTCKTCCKKPSKDDNTHRRRRGDKSNSKRKKEIMEETPSRTSEVSAKESCPAPDCPHGSKKNDDSCAPCCKAKFSKKHSNTKSKSLMTDTDFEKIKEQLRQARKKLDEAVAMVSRTVASSSSSYTTGKVTPETDATPAASHTKDKKHTEKSPFDKPSKTYDLQKCPLHDMTHATQSKTSKSKSATDNLLCLASCSNLGIPPCVSGRDSKKSEHQNTPSRTVTANSSNVSCTLMYPCDIPSVASGQSDVRPSPRPAKSLPTSSTKIEEEKRRPNTDTKVREEERHSRGKESDSKRVNIVCGSKEYKEKDYDAPCWSMCRDIEPPPCSVEEVLQKNAEELEKYLRKLSTEVNTSSALCQRMFPCEIPSTSSRQDAFRPSGKSAKSMPAFSTRIGETQQRNGVSYMKEEDNGYSRFRDGINRKQSGGGVCRASQTKGSNTDDFLCSRMCLNIDPPPCKSEEASFRRQTPPPAPQKYPPRSSPNLYSSRVPCTPMFPCEIPSATSEDDIVYVSENSAYANMRENEPRTSNGFKWENGRRQSWDNEDKRTRTSFNIGNENAPVVIVQQHDLNSSVNKDDKQVLYASQNSQKVIQATGSSTENMSKKDKKRAAKQNEAANKSKSKKGKKGRKSDEEDAESEEPFFKKVRQLDPGNKYAVNASTQTHTTKTLTLLRTDFEDEAAVDAFINNAMNSPDIEENVSKVTTVKFKNKKK